MAILNYVDVCAVVLEAPLIRDGDVSSRASCQLETIHGSRDKKHPDYISNFLSMTEEPRLIEEMSTWKSLDIVRITGFLATKETEKKVVCPKCGKINYRKEAVASARSGGNIVYVYPIHVRKIRSFREKDDAIQFLYENAEIANRVILMGKLTKNPESIKSCTHFQLAINRKYCVKGASDVTERTDYPWIYSYGNGARKDLAVLRQNSCVIVDGALRSRDYDEDYTCVECGEVFVNKGRTLEVLLFSREYLMDCDIERLKTLEE